MADVVPSTATITTPPSQEWGPDLRNSFSSYGQSTEKYVVQTGEQKAMEFMKFAAPSIAAGFAETVGESLGLIDDDALTDYLKQNAGSFGDYYARNKDWAQTVGDLGGMFLPGMMGVKAIRSGGFIARAISGSTKSRLLNSVFSTGKSHDELLRGLRARDRWLAKRGETNPVAEAVRQKFARQAVTTKLADTVKEIIAFEAATLATMNESQTLYPDEFSVAELIAMQGAGVGLFAGIEHFALRRAMRTSIQSVAHFAYARTNPADLPLNEVIYRPGNRDIGITINSLTAQAARQEAEKSPSALVKENMNKVAITAEEELQHHIERIPRDNPYPGFTNAKPLSKEHTNTLHRMEMETPYSILGTTSAEAVPENINARFLQRDTYAQKFQTQINGIFEKLEKEGRDLGVEDAAKIKELFDKKHEVEAFQFFIAEPGGNIVSAKGRKPTYWDDPVAITTKPKTTNEATMYTVDIGGGIYGAQQKRVIGVTENGQWIVPPVKQRNISGINVTKILPAHEVNQTSEHFRHLLRDMGEDWHYQGGHRGSKIFSELPREIQQQIDNWTGSSGASAIRTWVASEDERFRILYNSQEPMRRRLYELADDDGTIPLFRGESKRETKAPTNDVVSMTSDPRIAQHFGEERGGNVIARRVPVDDVIMIVGGLGREYEFIVRGNTKRNVGETITPGGFEALTLAQRTAGYAAGAKAIAGWGRKANPDILYLGEGAHHTQIDYVLELLNRYGEKAQEKINLPNGWGYKELQFASIRGKYAEWLATAKTMDAGAGAGIKLADNQKFAVQDFQKMFNLPGTNTGELHPMLELFASLKAQGVESISDVMRGMDDFHSALQGNDMIFAAAGTRPVIETRGNMYRIPTDERPVLLIKKPVTPEQHTREHLQTGLTNLRALVHGQLATATEQGAPLVGMLYKQMTEDYADLTATARRVDTLAEGGQKGSNAIFQQAENIREMPAAHAASTLQDITDRRMRKVIGEQIMEPVNQIVQKLRSNRNTRDLTNFNLLIHARREGWDILPDVTVADTADGLVTYTLDPKSTFNKERWKKVYGGEMPEGAMLPAPTKPNPDGTRPYKPLAVSQLAHEGLAAVSTLGIRTLRETNFLRNVHGQGRINEKTFWVPPKNFSRQETVFILDPTGHVHSVHAGRTHAEALEKAKKAQEQLGDGFVRVDRKNVELYNSLNDQAFERMLDFSDPLNQTGRSKGTSVGPVVDMGPDVLNDIMTTMNRQFESILRRTRATVFESEIQYARNMYSQAWARDKAAEGKTIFQQYLSNMFGNPTLNPNSSILGKNYYAIEGAYDKILQVLQDKVLKNLNPKHLVRHPDAESRKLYDQLNNQLGNFNPFKDANDFLARTHNLHLPTNMKKHMGALSNVTSLLVLRLFEAGHAVLNMTSLMATTPAVVKSLARRVDETEEQWRSRIGAWGTMVDGDHAYLNPSKAITTAIHDMFTEEGKKVWQAAAKEGLLDQDVEFIFRTLTAPGQGYITGLAEKHGRIATILSDKSETLSRAISFMVGHSIGTRGLGLKEEGARFAFAHKFANDNIGDYRANNRPNIFQGAVGMPLGLFTTFMWNYYQRVFSYIERKDLRTLATQYAMQASVFGAGGVPGWSQFVDTFGTNYDGTANPVDGMRNRFGDEVTDWFMYGALSNLPKMFGADDGVSLYTRGDITVRGVPNLLQIQETPSFRLLADVTTAMGKFLQQLKTREGVSYQQTMEIIANYSPNRFFKNMAILGSGYTVDRRGQVVNDDVYSEMSILSRVLGMRPMQESRKMETMRAVRSTELSQRERMTWLRDRARADARAGKTSSEDLSQLAGDYVKYGGNPAYFARWMRDQYMVGTQDKTQMELVKAIKDPTRGYDVLRLMSALELRPNDPEFAR